MKMFLLFILVYSSAAFLVAANTGAPFLIATVWSTGLLALVAGARLVHQGSFDSQKA